jgi:hypothetical protein
MIDWPSVDGHCRRLESAENELQTKGFGPARKSGEKLEKLVQSFIFL